VITFEHVTKSYEGAAHPAVDDLSLSIPEGQTVVLIGPSGCGKSTTLRMVNRLIEPDAGTVSEDGRDVRDFPPAELRRHIGYAIQGVGLFPHFTVAENIGVVPGLLGWDTERTAARVAELLDLVGLDAATYADKYPDELSGGEAQRVGVARALAADPPVLLMDEPFGAVDPLTRERLQSEFVAIQARLKKTVVFVTHDIDEAVKLGDRIAIMREGRLVQFDTPERVLAYPADDFVAGFVGAERALKRLSLAPVSEALDPADCATLAEATVPLDSSLRTALARIIEFGVPVVGVTDESGVLVGSVSVESIVERFKRPLL
jgi:osmoprotectant transport system ATP-binding protein